MPAIFKINMGPVLLESSERVGVDKEMRLASKGRPKQVGFLQHTK